MIELKKSDVVFDELNHKYFLEDKELSGITRRLGKSIFFHGKFDGIPKHILENKAKFGSMVHKQIENYDLGLEYTDIDEVKSYIKLKERLGIDVLASEFLVSDGHTYATCIDMVSKDIDFFDHKTSAKLDKEYLSWQLSINGYLFKMQTGVEPRNYYAIHYVKGKAKEYKIEKKSDDEVYDMLYTDKYMYIENALPSIDGMPSIDKPEGVLNLSTSEIQMIYNIESYIKDLEATIKSAKEEKEKFLKGLEEKMDANGISKVEIGKITITKTSGYTRTDFDKEKFLAENPSFDGMYLKSVQVKGGIKIKIKD